MTDSTAANSSVLLVTRKTHSQGLSWADVATSAREAMDLWKARRHPYVFADLGDLGDNISGARLSAMIRKESQEVMIVLMSDRVQPHQIAWARSHGAAGMILRTVEAIAACLPPELRPPIVVAGEVEVPSGFPMDDSPEAVLRVVDERLQKHARLGPARSVVLQDAMQDLLEEKAGQTPTVYELAMRVSGDIESDAERIAFINSFTGNK